MLKKLEIEIKWQLKQILLVIPNYLGGGKATLEASLFEIMA